MGRANRKGCIFAMHLKRDEGEELLLRKKEKVFEEYLMRYIREELSYN